jgi:hypothetical protein
VFKKKDESVREVADSATKPVVSVNVIVMYLLKINFKVQTFPIATGLTHKLRPVVFHR